jgi:hypothetical protein
MIPDTCASGGAVDLFQVVSRNPFALRGEVERLSCGARSSTGEQHGGQLV